MKVLTAYPVVINKKRVSPPDYYLNVDNQPTAQQIEEQKKKGLTWDKVKGTWVKAKESGLIDSIVNFLTPSAPVTPTPTPTPTPSVEPPPPPKGMSTTTKIVIGVGAVAVLGAIIYFATKDKGTTKK